MKISVLILLSVVLAVPALADEPTDSLTINDLNEVVVEARTAKLDTEVSTFIPSSREKSASQSATDLLARMAIPQITVTPGESVTTLSGKAVDIFIDYIPATPADISGMRTKDVKRVEYYVYPSDPRFQGKAYVVNFIMQKYEYGGYVKALAWENTTNVGQFSLFGKVQYRRMTLDVAIGAFYKNQSGFGSSVRETFRLPQPDGSVSIFERQSLSTGGKSKNEQYWPTFKALYATDKVQIQNLIGATFDHQPFTTNLGSVTYTPQIVPDAEFANASGSRVNSLSYSGNWTFILNDYNSINFVPSYGYSHTRSRSLYTEQSADFHNAAVDNSHEFWANLTYGHTFGEGAKGGKLNVLMQTIITANRTAYSGTSSVSDNAHTYRLGPGVQYSLKKGKVYGLVGLGLHWDRQEYVNNHETSTAPWIDFSLQYSPTDRHELSTTFHHMKTVPSPSCRSAAVIQSNPLMSYTGNPNLVSAGSYDVGVDYSYMPNNRFSFTAFGSLWLMDDRYVYDYQPTPTGLLRTIEQPGGHYFNYNYGVYGSARLFDNKLRLTAQIIGRTVDNGGPYDLKKTAISSAFQAYLYLGNWTFGATYMTPSGYSDGYMVGSWVKTKSYLRLQAGWANSTWNVNLHLTNLQRWHKRGELNIMHSTYYDRTEQALSLVDRAFARIAVTYTFGFGKKVQQGNEATQQSAPSSSILK